MSTAKPTSADSDTLSNQTRTAMVSVVILSYNRKARLLTNLSKLCRDIDAAHRSGAPSFEVIVVDNASVDGSGEAVLALCASHPYLSVISNAENLGVARGRNIGYRRSTGRYVLNLDDDAFVSVEDILTLLDVFDTHPQVGIVSPMVRHETTGEYQSFHGTDCLEISNFHGACHMFRAEVFEKVGYLDPLCSFGGEELDFSVRCFDAGYRTLYVPRVVATHDSIVRSGVEGAWRRKKWVYNFIRVQFKHFGLCVAVLHSSRYFASSFASALRETGPKVALSLLPSAVSGAVEGLDAKQKVSSMTQLHYRRRDLKPDFGNVPFATKLKARLSGNHSRA